MEQKHTTRCQDHFEILPCAKCEENDKRGYAVLMLAGRCANGSELDHGTRWHAVKPGKYQAVCGAKPGRRSVGWSSFTMINQPVTCPRCIKKLTIDVDGLISKRDKLLTRRDGLYDHAVVDRIDAQLSAVPPGQREDVDYALGRVLPKSAARWSTDSERAGWKDNGAEKTAQLAAEKQDEWFNHVADQHEDMMDFLRLCGDLAL